MAKEPIAFLSGKDLTAEGIAWLYKKLTGKEATAAEIEGTRVNLARPRGTDNNAIEEDLP